MTTKYEMIVCVDDKPDKRQQLTCAIDIALICAGARIGVGAYEVTIRRLSDKEVADMKSAEEKETE